jgi:hypothetical protein
MYSYSDDLDLPPTVCRFCGRPGACYSPAARWPAAPIEVAMPDAPAAHLDCAARGLDCKVADLDTEACLYPLAENELRRVQRVESYASSWPSLADFGGMAACCALFVVAMVLA